VFEASVAAVPELQASVVDLQASTLTADDRSVSAARKADEIQEKVEELLNAQFFQEMEFDRKVQEIQRQSLDTVQAVVDPTFLAMGRQVDDMADLQANVTDVELQVDRLSDRIETDVIDDIVDLYASHYQQEQLQENRHTSYLTQIQDRNCKIQDQHCRIKGLERHLYEVHKRLQMVEASFNQFPLGLAGEPFRQQLVAPAARQNATPIRKRRGSPTVVETPVRRSPRLARTPLHAIQVNLVN
jgi:hypothetical protein